jgi:uncharacterized RDD family membrane protein YckC
LYRRSCICTWAGVEVHSFHPALRLSFSVSPLNAATEIKDKHSLEKAKEENTTMEELPKNYAGFWRRFLAAIIDGFVLSVPFYVLETTIRNHSLWSELVAQGYDLGALNMVIEVYILLYSTLVIWAYNSGMESSPFQATLGKLALGLYVTDLKGQRISLKRATGRTFAKFLSIVTLLLGYLGAGFTSKKQALHDLVAGCLVLRK